MHKKQSCVIAWAFSIAGLFAGPLAADSIDVAINIPEGQLQGTLERAAEPRAAALILPGSGPTDRNGNQGPQLQTDTYRLLAEQLAEAGITTLRIDKRGIGGSDGDGNAVSLATYRQDSAAWATALRTATGLDCVWLIGHSEGGILALHAQDLPGVCGLVLLASPGRPLGPVILEQLAQQPQFADQMAPMATAIDQVASGQRPDVSDLAPSLAALFAGPAGGYFAELIRTDPAALIAETELPVLALFGDADIQVPSSEGDPLLAANRDIDLRILADMSHTLKAVTDGSPEANLATYGDPNLPLHPELVPAIAGFLMAP